MPSPVEEIKSRIDIVDLIQESIQLKQTGSSWKARCPFHNEKTPSFMVSRERGSWHCFGCARGGDIFTYVMEMEGLDFPEALRLLAKRAGVQLKEFDPKIQTQRTKMLDVLRWVARYYHEVLLKGTNAAAAREYLQARGLTDDTIEDWQLGFAPSGGDTTYQALHKKGFSDDDIFQAGLTIKKDRGVGWYDRFRQRIMFPIHDVHGAVVGFTGRILEVGLDPKKPLPAKYINSPQTLVYNKGQVLYGLDKAKQAIKKEDRVVLVEGNMDAIASHQAGIKNVVAASGTALTREQVQLIKRFSLNVVLSLDRDAAGAQATIRGLEQAWLERLNVTILRLPFGKDPDEVIRKDPAAWRAAISQAEPVLDSLFADATAGRDLTSVVEKKAVAKILLPILSKVVDPIEQSHYLQKLADMLHVDEASLRTSLTKPLPPVTPSAPTTSSKSTAPVQPDRYRAISERLLALILHRLSLLDQLSSSFNPETLVGDDLRALYKQLVLWYTQNHSIDRQDALAALAAALPEHQDLLTLLVLLGDKEYPDDRLPEVDHDMTSLLVSLRRRYLDDQLRQLAADIGRVERQSSDREHPELVTLLESFRQVTDELRRLADADRGL